MKNSRDGKSYSTNLAYTPPEYLRNGIYLLWLKSDSSQFLYFSDIKLVASSTRVTWLYVVEDLTLLVPSAFCCFIVAIILINIIISIKSITASLEVANDQC